MTQDNSQSNPAQGTCSYRDELRIALTAIGDAHTMILMGNGFAARERLAKEAKRLKGILTPPEEVA